MKKLFFSMFSVALVFGSFFNGHVQVGATSNSADLVEPAAVYSKSVSELRYYAKLSDIKPSITYNANGWSGTLYKAGVEYDGVRYVVSYRGTVSCSGTCVMSQEEEQ